MNLHSHPAAQVQVVMASHAISPSSTTLASPPFRTDDNGYLLDGVDVMLEGLNRDIVNPEDQFELNEFESVLRLVQHLDPAGCGARDASECMSIQIGQLAQTDDAERANTIVTKHLSSTITTSTSCPMSSSRKSRVSGESS